LERKNDDEMRDTENKNSVEYKTDKIRKKWLTNQPNHVTQLIWLMLTKTRRKNQRRLGWK